MLATSWLSALPVDNGSFPDLGSGWLAWLRLAVAAAGAFLLARKLGLALPGASLAALGFGSSGFLVQRIDSPAGQAALFLPWILVAIENARAELVRAWRAWIATCVLAALSMLGGDPPVAALVFSVAVIWILAGWNRDARAAMGSLVALAVGVGISALAWPPLAAELRYSGALARQSALLQAHRFDFIALALVLVATGIVLRWRTLAARDEEHIAGDGSADRERASWAGILGVALCVLACAAILVQRGLPDRARVTLVGDALGAPNSGGYRGQDPFVEAGSAHLALVVIAFALAAFFSPRGALARRSSVQALALASLLLACGVPGVVDAWRVLPILGLADPSLAAGVAALFVSLLAGDALETSKSAARRAAALVALGLLVLCFVHGSAPAITPAMGSLDPADGLVGWTERPGPSIDGGRVGLTGWLHPAVPFDSLRVRVDALDARGQVVPEESRELAVAVEGARSERAADAPPGAVYFRALALDVPRMRERVWRFSLDFYRKDAHGAEVRTATRTVAISALSRAPRLSAISAVLALATLIALLCVPAGAAGGAWVVVALALVQAVVFAWG